MQDDTVLFTSEPGSDSFRLWSNGYKNPITDIDWYKAPNAGSWDGRYLNVKNTSNIKINYRFRDKVVNVRHLFIQKKIIRKYNSINLVADHQSSYDDYLYAIDSPYNSLMEISITVGDDFNETSTNVVVLIVENDEFSGVYLKDDNVEFTDEPDSNSLL